MANLPSQTPTLGKPSISTPNALDLRVLQAAVSNTRERIEQIEAVLRTTNSIANTNTNNASGGSSSVLLKALRADLDSLTARVAALETAIANDTVVLTAGAAILDRQPVVPSGVASCVPLAPSNPLHAFAPIGLALGPAAPGAAVTVQRRGAVTVNAAGFVTGKAVYGTATGLTQSPALETAVFLGVALDSSTMWLAPGVTALADALFDATYEGAMPVTYGLVQTLINSIQGGDITQYDDQGRAGIASDGGAHLLAHGA